MFGETGGCFDGPTDGPGLGILSGSSGGATLRRDSVDANLRRLMSSFELSVQTRR